jgi:hypothetical protein
MIDWRKKLEEAYCALLTEDIKQIDAHQVPQIYEKIIQDDIEWAKQMSGISADLLGKECTLDKGMTSEFGCSFPVRFNTSDGIKTMEPGKRYDDNLNEIKECTCVNMSNAGDIVTCNCDVKEECILKPTDLSLECTNVKFQVESQEKKNEGLKRK